MLLSEQESNCFISSKDLHFGWTMGLRNRFHKQNRKQAITLIL